jgi:hypothetical protein
MSRACSETHAQNGCENGNDQGLRASVPHVRLFLGCDGEIVPRVVQDSPCILSDKNNRRAAFARGTLVAGAGLMKSARPSANRRDSANGMRVFWAVKKILSIRKV